MYHGPLQSDWRRQQGLYDRLTNGLSAWRRLIPLPSIEAEAPIARPSSSRRALHSVFVRRRTWITRFATFLMRSLSNCNCCNFSDLHSSCFRLARALPLVNALCFGPAADQVDRPQRMNVMDYASKIISSTSTAAECQGRARPDRRTRRRERAATPSADAADAADAEQALSTQMRAKGRAWATCRGTRRPPSPGAGTDFRGLQWIRRRS